MNKTVIDKEKCSGCQVCKQICPNNAIDMLEDKEGFLYPVKNERCIECGLCNKICPMVNEIKNNNLKQQEVFTSNHKNDTVVEKSASGGAFSAIVQAFCDNNYVIFGAKYNENNEVEHDYIENIKDIDIFRKSKYVQSDVKDSYSQAKKFLEQGKKVLFSGTPCQIAALKNYLRKEYDDLLCVDIICHGVPSPKVFRNYLEFWENKYNSKVTKIEFRKKMHKKEKWNSRNILLKFENGKEIIKDNENDLYLRAFYAKMIYRKSCSTCKFANQIRYSDITIGDSWGIEKIYPDIDVHKGESVIIVNTDKGKGILNKIKEYMNIRDLTIDFVIKENKQFREPTELNPKRDEFFANLDNTRFDKLVNKYVRINIKTKVKKVLKKIIFRRWM